MLDAVVTLLLFQLLGLLQGGVQAQVGTANTDLPTPPGPDQCVYSFTISQAQVRQVCGTQDLGGVAAQLRADYDRIIAENQALKETVAKLRADYEGMVEGVLKIEQETVGWREVVAWPNVEPSLKPDNSSAVTVDSPSYADCWDAYNAGHRKPGVYKIQPDEALFPFFAYCDKNGWLVIQRRFDGSESFYRSWDEYSRGFGNILGEFYLGNEAIHLLTAQRPYELRVELVGWNSKVYHSNYDDFWLGGETDEYAFHVGNMSKGNFFDVLTPLNDLGFTAKNRDNDEWHSANCADYYRGGWWLQNCGFDLHRAHCSGSGCMSWGSKNVKKSQLKIRPMAASGRASGGGGGSGGGSDDGRPSRPAVIPPAPVPIAPEVPPFDEDEEKEAYEYYDYK